MSQLPFNPDQLSPKDYLIYEAMVDARKRQGAPFDGPYAALMNHPELCEKIEKLGYYLKFQGHLSREIYQFVVLSVAQSTKVNFEWDDHVSHAVSVGVPLEVVQVLKKEGIGSVNFPSPYLYAASTLKSTLVYENIPSKIQESAIKAYGKYGFIEIVVLSGFYQMFSAINEGFDVALRPDMKSIFK